MHLLFKIIKDIFLYFPTIVNVFITIKSFFKKETPMNDVVKTDADIAELELLVALAFDIVIPILKAKKAAGKFSSAELVEFVSDPQFQADIAPALENLSKVSGEFKGFGIAQGVELSSFIVGQLKRIVEIYV